MENIFMNSKDRNFKKYCRKKLNKKVLNDLPRHNGVYVIIYKKQFGRFKGKSDIVYIGSASGNSNLKTRISQYFSPGQTQRTNQRINKLIKKMDDLSIALCCCNNDAIKLEGALLERYEKDHCELPPANRRI
jgi:excinuclease UvrABC nuclease subunit